jgi:hypothetical protein
VGSACHGHFNPPEHLDFFAGGNNLLQSYGPTACTMNGSRILADPLRASPGQRGTDRDPGAAARQSGDRCRLRLLLRRRRLTTDQRSFPRPDPGGVCDIGAYEVPEPGAAALGLASLGSLLLVRRLRARTGAA